MDKKMTRPVWAEIDLSKIRYNILQVRKAISQDTIIMAVIKANAYGHGAVPVARAAIKVGVERLAVAIPEEGAVLREAGLKLPIQVFGEVLSTQMPYYIKYDLIPSISKLETAKELNKLAREQGIVKKVHLLIDTGMGRIGVFPEKVPEFVENISMYTNLEIEGIMTHFAKADESNKEYTYQQWEKFNYVINILEEMNIKIQIKQIANSAAIIDLPDMKMDLVRPGIMIYGLMPSHEINRFSLKPALSWKAKIVYLKNVPPGYGIGYGATYFTKGRSKIATIPLGYADGYSRHLSNKGEVLIRGKRAAITGRICMDQFMVDVSNIPDVQIGDEVVLIGKQGNNEITATELANMIGTINYEIICSISQRVPRIYINS